MSFDPLSMVSDESLLVTPAVVTALQDFLHREKVPFLPGDDAPDERARISDQLNHLVDRLLVGVSSHPSKRWVLEQFVPVLERMSEEDTEVREHVGTELEAIMDIFSIESSNGLLGFYL